jgi:hypothetical protein
MTGIQDQPGERIAQGRTAEVYAWGDRQVLKLFYDWVPDSWVAREAEIGRMMTECQMPTPQLTGLHAVGNRKGILYERVEGRSMLNEFTARPWLVLRIARQFAALQSAIHQVDGAGLPELRPELEQTIQKVPNLPPELKEVALEALAGLPDGAALCHFDYHPGQVIITPGGPVVIDWMTARQGDPMADIARTIILLKAGKLPYANRAMRLAILLFRDLFCRIYLAHYLKLNPGASQSQIDRWMVPVAAGRLAEGIQGEGEFIFTILRAAESGYRNIKA